jgi:hypothetical protein
MSNENIENILVVDKNGRVVELIDLVFTLESRILKDAIKLHELKEHVRDLHDEVHKLHSYLHLDEGLVEVMLQDGRIVEKTNKNRKN